MQTDGPVCWDGAQQAGQECLHRMAVWQGVQEPRQNAESMHRSAQSGMKTYSRVGKTAKQFRVTAGMVIWHNQGDLASKL